MNNIKKKKIGVHGQQCIGPCYKANTGIIHPITFESITHDKTFCPTMNWTNNKNDKVWIDECLVADDIKSYTTEEKLLDYLIPTFGLTCESFLKTYYNIFSFENAIDWVTNNKEPYYSYMRIMNCSWKLYGLDMDVFNEQLINFYINVIKKKWIKFIYINIAKYIYVDKNDNTISVQENDKDINENKVEKINYFNKKFNTPQIIYKMLKSYVEEYRDVWNDIADHNDMIKHHYLNYIISKIKNNL